MKKIYIIGIGGIGASGLARYYKSEGYQVFGSDKENSALIEKLKKEGIDIIIGEDENRINNSFEKIVYSEAIPKSQKERKKAEQLKVKTLSYPQALGEISLDKKLIALAGTHGKSTTTSLVSLILKNSEKNFSAIVGTLLEEFDKKNFYAQKGENKNTTSNNKNSQKEEISKEEFFVLESCEYKEAFLNYHPYISVITNIEPDHLDYYKTKENYFNAFKKFIENIQPDGFAIINMQSENASSLLEIRCDINFIEVYDTYFMIEGKMFSFPKITMQVPGEHILFDARLAYIVGRILEIPEESIIKTLAHYKGVWRRMEIIKTTKNKNILMSDYGHHPTEIRLTTKAIKEKYENKKLFCVFQAHQYSRTLELLEDFKTCFDACDFLIIPDIYESRDSEEDKKKIDGKKLAELIEHPQVRYRRDLKNTLKIIQKYDKENPNSSVILLLGAGNVDNLRGKIE